MKIFEEIEAMLVGKWFILDDERLKSTKYIKVAKFINYYGNDFFKCICYYPLRGTWTNYDIQNFSNLNKLEVFDDKETIEWLESIYSKQRTKELLKREKYGPISSIEKNFDN